MAESKKKNWFARAWEGICRYFRELRSELKKVVWPTPKQVLKNALIVCACVLCGGVFIWVFDFVAEWGITKLLEMVHH